MAILGLTKIWITFGPVAAINILLLISLAIYMFKKPWVGDPSKRSQTEMSKRHTSKFLSLHLKEWWFSLADPVVSCCVRLSIRPSLLTFAGFVFSVVAAFLFAEGLFGFAGWAMIFGASFDMIDGRVARMTGQETRSGAFYDSVMDRFGEAACFLGLAFYFRSSWMLFFVIAGLIGSMLVSYTRARGESVGVICKSGAMQRPERIVYVGVSSILDPVSSIILAQWFPFPPPILVIGALIIIAVMTNVTAVQRMIYIMNELDCADKRGRKTLSQIITKLSTPKGREAFFTKARYGYDRSHTQFAHIIMFLLDGADTDTIKELLSLGVLPNIEKHIISRGCIKDAVSVFPSAPGPSFTPFVTGCFPGTCNVPGVRWFDRTVPSTRVLALNRFRDYLGWGAYAMDYDLAKSVRTIFEYSRRAVNIFGMVNRGCGINRDPSFFRLHSLFRKARKKADLTELEEAGFQWLSDAIRRETDFILCSLPSVDVAAANKIGKNAVKEAYIRFDTIIGQTFDLLKDQGLYDETAVFVASDHSHGVCEQSLDIIKILGQKISTLNYPAKLRQWNEARAIPLISGTSMAHIYLRKNNDWSLKSFIEEIENTGLVESLLNTNGIDIIAGRSAAGGIIVESRDGKAHLVEDADGRITYMAKGSDPFNFKNIPQTLDSESALKLTFRQDRPDAIMQILQMFRSPRTGDLVVSAAKGYSLEDRSAGRKNDSTHGSLMKEHILVPFLSNIPLKADVLRTVDIFALFLDLMGIDAAHHLDGTVPEQVEKSEYEKTTSWQEYPNDISKIHIQK